MLIVSVLALPESMQYSYRGLYIISKQIIDIAAGSTKTNLLVVNIE